MDLDLGGAWGLGIYYMASQCWLFVAMSRMQQGQYKIAKRIVRFVNNQAQTSGSTKAKFFLEINH